MHVVGQQSGKIALESSRIKEPGRNFGRRLKCGRDATGYSTAGFLPLTGNVDGHIYAAAVAEDDCMC